MKKTSSYEALDGKLFKTEEECIEWETKLMAAEALERLQTSMEKTDSWSYGEIKFSTAEDLVDFVRKNWNVVYMLCNYNHN